MYIQNSTILVSFYYYYLLHLATVTSHYFMLLAIYIIMAINIYSWKSILIAFHKDT